MMGKYVWIGNIKKDLLDPVILIHRVEGHPNLIKLIWWKLATQTVIDNFQICLREFCSFFQPYISKLAFGECNRFQLLTLSIIIHSPEYDLVAIVSACKH